MPISQTTKYTSGYPLGVASYICIAFFRKCFEKLLPLKRFDLVLLSSSAVASYILENIGHYDRRNQIRFPAIFKSWPG